jgi:hypothetical protein
VRSGGCSVRLSRPQWLIWASTYATQVRVGNITAQDASLAYSLWRHTDLTFSYHCLAFE